MNINYHSCKICGAIDYSAGDGHPCKPKPAIDTYETKRDAAARSAKLITYCDSDFTATEAFKAGADFGREFGKTEPRDILSTDTIWQSETGEEFRRRLFYAYQEVTELKAKLDIAKAALEKISQFFISYDGGRFGAFIDAGAVVIAKEALSELGSTNKKGSWMRITSVSLNGEKE